jgi:uncharacterized membrane protein
MFAAAGGAAGAGGAGGTAGGDARPKNGVSDRSCQGVTVDPRTGLTFDVMRRRIAFAVAVWLVALAGPAAAAEPVTQTFSAPMERVWSTTLAVLKTLGWDIDKQDRTIGWITTDSRRVEGEDYGVYAKGTRHRLTIHVKAVGDTKTAVSVERSVFKRERILWMDNDEPIGSPDTSVEKAILSAIGQSL